MLVSALAVLAGVFLSTSGSALAASPLPLGSPVTIVTPTSGLVTGHRLSVVVRTASNLKSFDARLGTRDVKSAFRSAGAGRWVGSLSSANGLAPGPEQLTIFTVEPSGRQGVATVGLLVGRSTGRYVVLSPVRWSRFAPGTTVKLRLRALPAVFSVLLNGRDVTRQFEGLGLARGGTLAADGGLHYGVNQLVVTAAGPNGDYTRLTRRITVPRVSPLVSAGLDRRTMSGEIVRLSAARTIAARKGDQLHYHWVVVTKPHGSKAIVRGASGGSPTVKPDLPGRYVLRLRVSETPLAGAGSSVPLLSLLPASDDVTLTNAPPIRPIGLAVDTMSRLSQFQDAIVLGTGPSDPNYHFFDIQGADGIAVVTLDRATLAVVGVNDYNINDSAAAVSYIGSLGSADIVIASAQQFSAARSGWSNVFKELGATPTTTVSLGNWSVIGVPGAPDGGISNTAGQGNPNSITPTEAGSMKGYLREEQGVTYPRYAFVLAGYASYATSSASSASQNTMTVGGTAYPSQAINCPSGGGLQLLALSALTLKPVASGTYATNCGNPSGDQQQLASLNAQLQGLNTFLSGVPKVLLLQSIGTPYPADASAQWYAVGLSLAGFGGTASVFDSATGAYALAGGNGFGEAGSITSYGAEASQSLTGNAGTLAGELRRDAQDHYQVIEGEPGLASAQALTQIIYPQKPLLPWVAIAPSVQAQIIPYVTDHFLSPTPASPSSDPNACYTPAYDDVRALYCDTQEEIYLLGWAQQLRNQTAPPAGSGFSAANWTAVSTELQDEMNTTADVYRFVKDLVSVYGTAQPLVDVESVYAQIEGQLPQAPSAVPSQSYYTTLAADLFSFGALIPGGELVFGIVGAAAHLAADVTTNSEGSPELDAPVLGLTADQLGAQLSTRYAHMSSQLGTLYNIIVSNAGRLRAFAQADFSSGFGTIANDKAALQASTQRVAFGSLLSASYRLDLVHEWQTVNPSTLDPNQCTGSAPCVNQFLCEEENYQWFPFLNAAPDAQFVVPIPPVSTSYGTDSAEIFAVADPSVNGAWYPDTPLSSWVSPVNLAATPTESLLAPLFDPLSTSVPPNTQQPLGLYKQWFWAHVFGQALVVPGSTATQAAVQPWAGAASKPYYFSCEE